MQRSSRVDYDAIAERYDSTPHREKSADPELIAFLAARRPTASLTLLDIACGTGNQQIANRSVAPNQGLSASTAHSACCARRCAKCQTFPGCTATARHCRLPRTVLISSAANTRSIISATRRMLREVVRVPAAARRPVRALQYVSAGVRGLALPHLFPGGEDPRPLRFLATRRDRFADG